MVCLLWLSGVVNTIDHAQIELFYGNNSFNSNDNLRFKLDSNVVITVL